MSEFDPKHPASSSPRDVPQDTPGATGIFGVLPASPAPATDAPAQPLTPAALPQAPSRFAAAPVVVHEVKFQAQDDGSEAESSLQRLLQSLAPVNEKPAPAAATGDFTRLLSTLQISPAPAPVPAATAPLPSPPATSATASLETLKSPELGAAALPEVVVSPQVHAPPQPEASSFTQLFAALGSPAAAPGVPEVADRFPAQSKTPPPAVNLSSLSAGSAGSSERHPSPPSSFGDGADPASFTQLFNALGSQPKPEPSQATDHPPLAARKPSFTPFPAASTLGFSAGGWSPGPPAAAPAQHSLPRSDDSDLSSLTQLLQALEHPQASPSPYAGGASVPLGQDVPRSSGKSGASGISGATVAFTPPESVQRRASQPPPPASGPGDFTRVLQASALRESGLGSQAAAAQHPPAAPLPSAPPSHGAGAPLPPWASPSMPYMPHVSGMAHANGSVPGLGPMPGLHGHAQGPNPHMQSAFMTPGPASQGAQGVPGRASSRGTILPLILMAIIVILVGVLVALLLRH